MQYKKIVKKVFHKVLPVALSVAMMSSTVLAEEIIPMAEAEGAVVISEEVETDVLEEVGVSEDVSEEIGETVEEADREEVKDAMEEADREEAKETVEEADRDETKDAMEEASEEEAKETVEEADRDETKDAMEEADREEAEEAVEEADQDETKETMEEADAEDAAQYDVTDPWDDFGFSLTKNGIYILSYDGTDTEVVIPDVYYDWENVAWPVFYIGDRAFLENTTVTSVVLPEGVKTIGERAFEGCTSLTTIKFPNTLTTIKRSAFDGCTSLKEITLPQKIKQIDYWAFRNCNSLKKVVLPKSITTMGEGVFQSCRGLLEAEVFMSFLPEAIFDSCVNLGKVTLSDNLTSIGRAAFISCKKLPEIQLPESLTFIDTSAFANCHSLKSITIPAGLTEAGSGVFSGNGLKNLTYLPSVVYESMFQGAYDLENITFSENLTEIGSRAFWRCASLKTITIPGTCKEMGWGALSECVNLEGVVFEKGATYVGQNAFYGCSALKAVSIPDTVTMIDKCAFVDCFNLKKLYIPSSVTTFGVEPFGGMTDLEITCEKGSAADDTSLYKETNVKFVYTKTTTLSKPTMTIKVAPAGRSVTFDCGNPQAMVFYGDTDNLTTKSKFVLSGDKAFFDDHNGKLYAKAYFNGKWSEMAVVNFIIPKIDTPTISYADGAVSLKTTTPGCDFYITTDGSVPTMENGIKVAGSEANVIVSGGTTFRAIAVKSGSAPTEEVSVTTRTNFSGTLQVPSFAVKGVFGGRNVTFNGPEGSKIYYSTSSSMSGVDKCVDAGETVLFERFYGTIYARTYKDGKWSNPARLILRIPTVHDPVIKDWGKGVYRVESATPWCFFMVTTDGTDPSPTHGTRITNTFPYAYLNLGEVKDLRIMAIRGCFSNSHITKYPSN